MVGPGRKATSSFVVGATETTGRGRRINITQLAPLLNGAKEVARPLVSKLDSFGGKVTSFCATVKKSRFWRVSLSPSR
jgi:hypothetical protein